MSDTMTSPTVDRVMDTVLDEGDHERQKHYVMTKPGLTPEATIMEARVYGTPVTALCGKTWVPDRDPQRFSLCQTCKEIFESLPDKHGE